MASILIADDNPENLKLLSQMLSQEGYNIRAAKNGEKAMQSIRINRPDLILLDIQMPKKDGYDVCREIKSDADLKSIPVIFISAMTEPYNKAMAFKTGGDDYIAKPVQKEEVIARVKTQLRIYEHQKVLKDTNLKLLHQFKNTFDQAVVGMAHVDRNTLRFAKVNKRFCEILGYTLDDLKTKTVKEITHPDHIENDDIQIQKLVEKKIDFISKENQYLRGDGSSVWGKVTISLIETSKGEVPDYFFVICEDISPLKAIQKKQIAYEQRLQQAQKMEAIGTLAGGIAHDFNNILSPIIGFAEILKTDLESESDLQNSVDHILNAGNRAKELVQQILTFSRLDDETIRPMKLQPIVKEALKLIRSTIPATIEISTIIDPQCGAVNADPTQIHQIVMNLATNAYHAMEKSGGMLEISLDQVNQKPHGCLLDRIESNSYARLRFKDDGVGIEPKYLNKILDPYFTTKDKSKGTGLGLSVVQGIVKKANGDILIKSKVGKGTQIVIFLPIYEKNGLKLPYAAEKSIPGGTERILIVDDEKPITAMLSKMLERLGYNIEAATDVNQALSTFGNNPEGFDLILTDLLMPSLNGFQLIEKLRRIKPGLPCIISTGYGENITPENCEANNIQALVYKPIVLKELAIAIRKIFD